jgi:hypothetical protein
MALAHNDCKTESQQCALCWAPIRRDNYVQCDQCEKTVCHECYEEGVYDCEVCPQCEKICCSGINDECALDGGFYHCAHANCHLCDDCVTVNARRRKEERRVDCAVGGVK